MLTDAFHYGYTQYDYVINKPEPEPEVDEYQRTECQHYSSLRRQGEGREKLTIRGGKISTLMASLVLTFNSCLAICGQCWGVVNYMKLK